MKILLFGVTGQLGYEVVKRAKALHFETVAPVESELDITEPKPVLQMARKVKPDLIINCAAYTAVDRAETEKERAFRVNRDGAKHAGLAAREIGARLIHLSTDYVFDGTAKGPLTEEMETSPLNVYGAAKLAGEKELSKLGTERTLVVRTSSLHGQKGANFVHTMLKLFAEREVVRVVNDQYMSPTWAGWLAEVLLDLGRMDCHGVVHAACAGVTTWFEFASAILELTRPRFKPGLEVLPISSAEYQLPAKRPAYSAFDCSKLSKLLGRKPLAWREGLKRHLSEIGYL